MRRLLPLLLGLCACLGTLACRSTEDIGGLKVQLLDAPESYDLSFVGNETFLAGTLQRAAREDLLDFEQTGFRRASIDDAAYTIESHYLGQGFPFASVGYELEHPEGGRPVVRFTVDEGPRCVVQDVQFTGNLFFPGRDLRRLLGGPTTALFGLGELYYVLSEARAARQAVEDRYYENGFLDVEVSDPEVEFDEARTHATLRYAIDEHVQFRLASVELAGLDEDQERAIRPTVSSFLGRPYFPRLSYEVRARVAQYFVDRGHPDAVAEGAEELDGATGEVTLTVTVTPGQEVRIRDVVVAGNEHTRDGFILSRVSLEPGDRYSGRAVQESLDELYRTGLFSLVKIELEDSGAERVLQVTVEEVRTLSVSGEVGYGAYERARAMVRIQEDNLAGTGRSLALEGKLAVKAQGASMDFTDPWTLGRENILGASLFYDLREEPSFDRKEVGGGVSLTRPHGRHWRNVYGYLLRFSDAKDIAVEIPGEEIDEGDNAYVSEVDWTSIYDSRDSPFLPTRGTWWRTRLEYAPKELASQLTYWRVSGRIARYHALGEKAVLAWSAQAGAIFPIDRTDEIPLQERFFNGGQNSVRSFREGRLGPHDTNGNPIGGEGRTVLSVELRHALFSTFTGALFADAGNVALRHQDFLDFSDFRYGVGPGIRWLLPIGPVRLDWGINPDRRPDEAKWVVQFSVGVAF